MKRFFATIGAAMYRFFAGRYGGDELNRLLQIISVVLMLLSLIPLPYVWLVSIPAYALMFYTLFRAFSRNIPARQKEGAAYRAHLQKRQKRKLFAAQKKAERKTHRYYACPGCHANLRVPIPRNRIVITCPRCGRKFEKGPKKPKQ